jgi:hypothetical protein
MKLKKQPSGGMSDPQVRNPFLSHEHGRDQEKKPTQQKNLHPGRVPIFHPMTSLITPVHPGFFWLDRRSRSSWLVS